MSLPISTTSACVGLGLLGLALNGNTGSAQELVWRWPSAQAPVVESASLVDGHSSPGPAARAALALTLRSQAQVDSQGVFLAQLIEGAQTANLPHLRIADAPAFGQALVWTRADIQAAVRAQLPHAEAWSWAGSQQVRVTRRGRLLPESDLKALLTAALQQEQIKDKGQLELRLTRPWAPLLVPDEPLTVRLLELPSTGLSPHFMVRFELVTARDRLGPWQVPVQARLWREVWVARSPLQPGTLLAEADVVRERRDLLSVGEPILADPFAAATNTLLELAEAVPAGRPITQRAVRPRPVVRRGQIVEAVLADGPLTIRLKVEALESGAPGQLVRVRNLESKREFKGKVQDAQTVLAQL